MAIFDVDLTDVASETALNSHIANTSNPHGVTKAQVGLSNVPNTDATNPANITQSASYRFTTDAEKAAWNAVIGGSVFQSTWNATTNSPALVSSTGTKGYYYIVATAGSTNLDGITDWKVGDWAIFDGSVWRKVDNTDAVSSVNGLTGAVSLDTSNVPDTTNKRYVTDADLVKLGNTSGTNTGDETAQRIGDLVNGATEKTTPVDADMVGLMDSAASNILKKLSWANIKATLKTYFDTLYFGRNTSTLSSDFTTSSATYTDITGLSVTLEANSTYMIWITTPYSSPATATGVGVSMTVTGSPTLRNVTRTQWTNTTVINSSNFGADDAGSIGATVGTAGQVYGCTFLCTFVTAGSTSVVQMRAARGGTSNTISIRAGATIVAVKIA